MQQLAARCLTSCPGFQLSALRLDTSDGSQLSPPGTGSPLLNRGTCGSKDGSGCGSRLRKEPTVECLALWCKRQATCETTLKLPTQSHALILQKKRLFVNFFLYIKPFRALCQYNLVTGTNKQSYSKLNY